MPAFVCMQASALLGGQTVEIQAGIWERASHALAAGAATLTPAAATASYQQASRMAKWILSSSLPHQN